MQLQTQNKCEGHQLRGRTVLQNKQTRLLELTGIQTEGVMGGVGGGRYDTEGTHSYLSFFYCVQLKQEA